MFESHRIVTIMSSVSKKSSKNDVATMLADNNRTIVKIDNKFRKRSKLTICK